MNSNEAAVLIGPALGLVALSFVSSAGLCDLARRQASRLGFLDRPGGHKGHRLPTPLGGGLVIWLTTVSIVGIGLLTVVARAGVGLPEPLARHASGVID